MKAEPELMRIWDWLQDCDKHCETQVLRELFWQLKAKIDDYKKRIKELEELTQPKSLTEEDKKRILSDFFEG